MTASASPTPETPPRPQRELPPDPAAYDSPRARQARARGLDAPYIPGGRDPDPGRGAREERLYGRLLVIMVIVIVAAGFVLGAITMLVGSPTP